MSDIRDSYTNLEIILKEWGQAKNYTVRFAPDVDNVAKENGNFLYVVPDLNMPREVVYNESRTQSIIEYYTLYRLVFRVYVDTLTNDVILSFLEQMQSCAEKLISGPMKKGWIVGDTEATEDLTKSGTKKVYLSASFVVQVRCVSYV